MAYFNPKELNCILHRFGYPWGPGIREMDPTLFEAITDGEPFAMDSEGNPHSCPDAMKNLDEHNPVRMAILTLFQSGPMAGEYQKAGMIALGREPRADGLPGTATYEAMSVERCGLPDYGYPVAEMLDDPQARAIGSGPWKGCHGFDHASHWRFTNPPPSHLNGKYNDEYTVFQEALRRVRETYREVGLMCYFSGPGTGDLFLPPNESIVQSDASFVSNSDGWIGLAIVGNNNMTCTNQRIWERFLASFDQSNSNIESKVHAWHLLLTHEKAHNCGLGHTNDPDDINYPVLNRRSNGRWIGDSAESFMKGRFGGVPVPKDDPGPGPGPGPGPEPPGECDCSWWTIIKCLFKKLTGKSIEDELRNEMRRVGAK